MFHYPCGRIGRLVEGGIIFGIIGRSRMRLLACVFFSDRLSENFRGLEFVRIETRIVQKPMRSFDRKAQFFVHGFEKGISKQRFDSFEASK